MGQGGASRCRITMPMDLAGTPSITLPSGFSPEGLPYAIQFAGRHLSEPLLFRLAHAYEQATPWHSRHPAVDAWRAVITVPTQFEQRFATLRRKLLNHHAIDAGP